jgi:hypothetical protein
MAIPCEPRVSWGLAVNLAVTQGTLDWPKTVSRWFKEGKLPFS